MRPKIQLKKNTKDILTGNNGEVQYSFDNLTGKMTISGTGKMGNYFSPKDDPPLKDYREEIIDLIVDDGVTDVNDNTFEDCINLKTVQLSNSLTRIGVKSCQNWY